VIVHCRWIYACGGSISYELSCPSAQNRLAPSYCPGLRAKTPIHMSLPANQCQILLLMPHPYDNNQGVNVEGP
jgi:hypothetical protein